MNKKLNALTELIAAFEEDQQMIDDKNVDTVELEALIEKNKSDYLAARQAAYQRILDQRNVPQINRP